MNRIDGCIQTYPKDAAQVAEALQNGPVMFSWTDGSTQYDFYMVPVSSFETWFEAPEKIHRWFSFNAEKLGLDRMAKDSVGVADLFNMIATAGQKFGRNIVI